jgi:hypothetical protein
LTTKIRKVFLDDTKLTDNIFADSSGSSGAMKAHDKQKPHLIGGAMFVMIAES